MEETGSKSEFIHHNQQLKAKLQHTANEQKNSQEESSKIRVFVPDVQSFQTRCIYANCVCSDVQGSDASLKMLDMVEKDVHRDKQTLRQEKKSGTMIVHRGKGNQSQYQSSNFSVHRSLL